MGRYLAEDKSKVKPENETALQIAIDSCRREVYPIRAMEALDSRYSPTHELANAITHGAGAVLSVLGLVLLISCSASYGTVWHVTSSAIFGATMVLLYCSSTLYHSLRNETARRIFRKLDHASIFLLIAGTYTPVMLIPLRGPWGWSLFGVIWGLAIPGVILKFWYAGRFKKLSTALFLGMGWLIVIAAHPMLEHVRPGALILLAAGGLSYSVGSLFYLWKSLPYNHAIWHLFVLGGTSCHFFAVYSYLLPRA